MSMPHLNSVILRALARRSRASLEGRTADQLQRRAASFEALASLGRLRMTA